MALDAGPFIRRGTRGSPSWPGFDPETGYVDADCSDQVAEIACGRGGPYVCALAVAVDLDDGGVDHGVLHVRLVRDGIKKPFENIGFDPIAISLEDGVPRAE